MTTTIEQMIERVARGEAAEQVWATSQSDVRKAILAYSTDYLPPSAVVPRAAQISAYWTLCRIAKQAGIQTISQQARAMIPSYTDEPGRDPLDEGE